MSDYAELNYLLDLFKPDPVWMEQVKKRHRAICDNTATEYIPLLRVPTDEIIMPEYNDYKHWSLREQFYDKEKMLIEHLWNMISVSRAKMDLLPNIRVNFGVGTIPSIFGIKERFVQDNQMPWTDKHLTKEEIIQLHLPSKISEAGFLPKIREYIEYFISKLGTNEFIYVSDTQGPFDIAHLLRGADIYMDIYDDPKFVHSLMKIATQAYIEFTKINKKIIGQAFGEGMHSGQFFSRGNIRLCNDSSTNLSHKIFEEFVLSYDQKALKSFEGGWVHFCGSGHQWLDQYLKIPDVYGINFGNPERYDFKLLLPQLIENNKYYVGGWARSKEQSIEDYFRQVWERVCKQKRGLFFSACGDGKWPILHVAMELWHKIQDEC